MNSDSTNYFNYFTEIEEHFVRKRGRNLLVSPLDWCLIELWRDQGIPLHVALRGIDRSFEAVERKGGKPPRTLYYCHPAVIDAQQEYQEATLGSEEDPPEETVLDRELLGRQMRRLRQALSGQEGPAYERALSRLEELSQGAAQLSSPRLEDFDRALCEVQSNLLRELSEELDQEVRRDLESTCRKELKKYRKHLSKPMFEQLSEKRWERALLDHFGLPTFSLLDLANEPDHL